MPGTSLDSLLSRFHPDTGAIDGAPTVTRRLSDLGGCFADPSAWTAVLSKGDPIVYTVTAMEPAGDEGDLHYGLGRIMPGCVGAEYFMTKGHFHAWRPAGEFYFGLEGEGLMLLEDGATGESRIVPLRPHHAVYVPGNTAHRTINTGSVPLAYLGVYPARAGHDYAAIATRNFRCVVIEQNGAPTMVQRKDLP
ncbi:MAG: cupin domain-containing protein [Verrucomicrobiales bacterium]|nr:cupin domain-containing protein [Verrucomicrobiales bacterium]